MLKPARKAGRPRLSPSERCVTTTVSLTRAQQVQFVALGGSKWLREQIKKANDASGKS